VIRLGLLIIAIIILVSCSADATGPNQPEQFPLKYQLLGLSDSSLNAVELWAMTYYPEIDKSIFQLRNFQNEEFQDSLAIHSAKDVYFGCTREFAILTATRI
jgi:hypothetical protein